MSKDTIYRQDAIDAIFSEPLYESGMKKRDADAVVPAIYEKIKSLPSAQPERLTDDDFETIRIHLNAYKEKLCNQQRWEEAEEYQRIIDRLIAFASAEQEIIRCKDCKFYTPMNRETKTGICNLTMHQNFGDDWYCAGAERRTDE